MATALRFERSSIRQVGRLLAVLAAQRPRGLFAEVGTGCGVGTAWLASALGPEAALVTDMTPEELWPEEWRGRPDPVRDFWLEDPRLRAAELLTTPSTAAVVATKNPS